MMKNELRRIHRKVRRCNRCEDILKKNVLPRSGFPPRDIYKAIIIGAEPGPKAKTLMTPTQYEKHFMPGTKNTNRVRLLFEDLKSSNIDYSEFFFTNAVKCPSKSKADSRKCFKNCETYLRDQIAMIKPKFLIVIGSAANLLRIKKAQKDTIERDIYRGIPAIVVRHPQGATKEYRKQIVRRVKYNLKR